MKQLHAKVLALQQRANPVNYSNVSVNDRGELVSNFLEDLNNRIISGYALRWGTVNMHGEMFLKGCCSKSLQERGPGSAANYKITFLNQHDPKQPLSLFAELVEDDYGLRFRSLPLDNVKWADDVLTQVRSGTLNQFSAGFNYVWDKTEWDTENDCILCKEIDLYENSIVTIGSEAGTFVIRNAEQQNELFNEIETFVKDLPRKHQLQARQYFTELKTLIDNKPQQQRHALETDKPDKEKGIDYEYLTKNFTL
jgi:HK97 family phage prohead protease